jgi:hypothetical protein
MTKGLISCIFFLMLVGCSSDAARNFFSPVPQPKKIDDGDGEQLVFDAKADILFVVDDSGSMQTHQTNLAANISQFTSVLTQTSLLEYRIGVITTDNEDVYATKPCCGKLVGETRVVTPETPDSNAVLQNNLLVGTGGSGREAPFDTLSRAFAPEILATWNSNFLRSSAALIVIFITDAEDQSRTVEGTDVLNRMLALKRNDRRKVLGYGAIVPTSVPSGCARDQLDVTPKRIEEFLDLVPNGVTGGGRGNNIVSLCATDFGKRLAEFALDIVDQVGSTIYLTRFPEIKTIRVTYGDLVLPEDPRRGWSYNPSKNAIQLGSEIEWSNQPIGSKIRVFYQEARGLDSGPAPRILRPRLNRGERSSDAEIRFVKWTYS